jgi:ribokinase
MKIWNFGSINIDIRYEVSEIVCPGQTLSAWNRSIAHGGKGLNQSVAIARAGVTVSHIGKIGQDGVWLRDFLSDSGVDTFFVDDIVETPTGHAVIQVASSGENSIVLFPGANVTFPTDDSTDDIYGKILDKASSDDWVLLQNETNCVAEAIAAARQRGLKVAFNAAPADNKTRDLPLDRVNLLIVNEGELERISGQPSIEEGLAELKKSLPETSVIVTLGAKGCRYQFQDDRICIPSDPVPVVDTTGAGDTFVGYFLAEFASTGNVAQSLRLASRAAGISVSRIGAASSIPFRSEVERDLCLYGWYNEIGYRDATELRTGVRVLYEEDRLLPEIDEEYDRIPENPYEVSPRGFVKIDPDSGWIDPRNRRRRIYCASVDDVLSPTEVLPTELLSQTKVSFVGGSGVSIQCIVDILQQMDT